jgi:hypothetical protein
MPPDSLADGTVTGHTQTREDHSQPEAAPQCISRFPDVPPHTSGHGPYWCRHRGPPYFDPATGDTKHPVCGRPRCSQECRAIWARRRSRQLRGKWRHDPPTHHLRITVHAEVSDKALERALARFTRLLGRAAAWWVRVTEWSNGKRHWHWAVRALGGVTPAVVRDCWQRSLPDVALDCAVGRVRNPMALARYLVKDERNPPFKELPPEGWRGQVIRGSRGYLARRPKPTCRSPPSSGVPADALSGCGAAACDGGRPPPGPAPPAPPEVHSPPPGCN